MYICVCVCVWVPVVVPIELWRHISKKPIAKSTNTNKLSDEQNKNLKSHYIYLLIEALLLLLSRSPSLAASYSACCKMQKLQANSFLSLAQAALFWRPRPKDAASKKNREKKEKNLKKTSWTWCPIVARGWGSGLIRSLACQAKATATATSTTTAIATTRAKTATATSWLILRKLLKKSYALCR